MECVERWTDVVRGSEMELMDCLEWILPLVVLRTALKRGSQLAWYHRAGRWLDYVKSVDEHDQYRIALD